MSVRVRFAPSPTGLLHVGALRTALFDALYAQKHQGVNILRIEDTDRTRYNPDSESEFVETLGWVGIRFDEGPHVGGAYGPYRQSERKGAGIYDAWVQKLLESGHGYKAFETSAELEEMREYQQINKLPVGYFGGSWRDASESKVAEAQAEGRPFVIRLRVPRGQKIVLQDAIRGRLEWDSDTIDDPVLIKADGMPTYHFAAIVDDHLMGITHVFRGEEWISSAPKHVVLGEVLGFEQPIYVHCPVIVGDDGKKLSKRHGATRVLDYAAQGFLPHPLKNFIALIGWSPGDDREVLSPTELVSAFSLEGLQPSPGRFDYRKLLWLNGHAIRSLTAEQILGELERLAAFEYAREFHLRDAQEDEAAVDAERRKSRWQLLEQLIAHSKRDHEYVLRCLELERERVETLMDFGDACAFFLADVPAMDPKARDKWLSQQHVPLLLEKVTAAAPSAPHEFEAGVAYWTDRLHAWQTEMGFEKMGPIVHPIRVALTGKTVGPGLFELMSVLGPERIRERIAAL